MADLGKWASKHGLTLSAVRTVRNPLMPDWSEADHWKCKLRLGRKSLTVYFSKGYGHDGRVPVIGEVLECMQSDANGYQNAGSFEEWCSEYGADTDSRKAERTFKACEKQANGLRSLMGDVLYEQFREIDPNDDDKPTQSDDEQAASEPQP